MTVRITAENLGAAYGSNVIWSGINLDMSEPGLISILGPNGAGKSTFMYMINKILEPAEGRVLINGEDVMDLSFKDIAKLIAYVPQASGETFAMTVMDTVLMGRYPHSGYTVTEEDLEIAADCLEKMHMAEFAMRNFNELSAGQHQRVMIARGLAQEPELLMLDEPTSNLDIYHQIRTMRLLRDIAHQKGIMVLVICHDLNIAAKFSDRVIMFQKGSIYADGTAAEVLTAETIKDVYNVNADVIEVKGRPYVIYHNEGDVDDDRLKNNAGAPSPAPYFPESGYLQFDSARGDRRRGRSRSPPRRTPCRWSPC
jgi:iron complex transport system ATP-binding protein